MYMNYSKVVFPDWHAAHLAPGHVPLEDEG